MYLFIFPYTFSNQNCLLNSSSVFNSTEYQDALTMLPGLRYTRDEQCQAIIGESGSFYSGLLSSICTVLQCYRPSTNSVIDYEGRALDLTTCGNHMVFNGLDRPVQKLRGTFCLLRHESTILSGLPFRSMLTCISNFSI